MPWKGIFTIDISSALKYCWKDWMGGGGGVCEKKEYQTVWKYYEPNHSIVIKRRTLSEHSTCTFRVSCCLSLQACQRWPDALFYYGVCNKTQMIVRRVSALPYLSLIGDNRNKQADRNLHLMLTITNALCSSLGIGISWDILTPTLVFPQTR